MALPSLVDIVTVIVLIVPGFFAFLIVKNIVPSKRKKFSDFETTVFSLMYSLPILATYSLLTGVNEIDALTGSVFQVTNLAILMGLSFFWGFVPGFLARFIAMREYIMGECWDEFGDRLGDGAYVIVFTEDGCEYKGWIHFFDKTEGKYELILGDPKLIIRDAKWKVLQEIEMGHELLFTEKDIRRIVSLKSFD